MTLVRLIRPWRVYFPGETAGFDAAGAAQLVRDGVAVPVEPDGPGETAAPVPAPRAARRAR